MPVYSDCASEVDVLQWSWKEGTRVRMWDGYEFYLTVKPNHINSTQHPPWGDLEGGRINRGYCWWEWREFRTYYTSVQDVFPSQVVQIQ
jgi:hypothetical protein